MLRRLATFFFNKGYRSSGPQIVNDQTSLASGSENLIFTGTGANRIFKGIAQRTGSPTPAGSRVMMNVGDSYGGLGQGSDSTAFGSIFKVLGSIFYIGAGRLFYAGVPRSTSAPADISATSTLRLQRFVSGALETTFYDAGLPQPDAPTIFAVDPPTGLLGKNDGTVSVKVARVRSATGARSIASLTSNVVACKNQSVLIQFPLTSAGQDYWEVDVTLNGYGGLGNHYFLTEIAESAIAATATNINIDTVGDNTVKIANGDIGTTAVGYNLEGTKQWESVTVVLTGTVGAGDMKTVVTSGGSTLATITFAVSASATAADVADALYTALGDSAITGASAPFERYKAGAQVFLKKKTGTDSTMNFTLQDAAVSPATNITNVTTSDAAPISSWVTAVGAADSGGSGKRLVTVNNVIPQIVTAEPCTLTKAASGYTRSYIVEWKDADLAGADFAPIREYPPPAAMFGGVTGDVVFVDGAFGDNVNLAVAPNATSAGGGTPAQTDPASQPGNAIAVSDPVKPEAFPPDNYIFTGDSPTALLEGSRGVIWRFARNSLGVITYIGGSPAISYERIWSGIGIQNQNNATIGAGGRLYAYTGTRGAVRMGSEGAPDTAFAAPVADDMAGWTPANVVLGYDANYQYVFYAHNQTILAYFEPADIWCAPLNLSATLGTKKIRSMVTVNSEVYIAAGDDPSVGTPNPAINLYSFDTGSGTVGKLVTHWQQSPLESDILSRIRVALRSDGVKNMNVKAYTNGKATADQELVVPVQSGIQVPTTLRPNVRNAKIWKVEASLTSAGGDAGWENIVVEGDTSGITF